MARITVEDCLQKVHNRFTLVLLTVERVKELVKGDKPLIDPDDNREIVTALREIAQGKIILGTKQGVTDQPLSE